MFDPLTIAIGAIGTGIIFISFNLICSLRGLPIKVSNTQLGIVAIMWGILDQARYMLALPGSLSIALFLIVFGTVALLSPFLFHQRIGQQPGSV
jgi:hypothetical protein